MTRTRATARAQRRSSKRQETDEPSAVDDLPTTRPSRVVVSDVRPTVDGGRYPVKVIRGDEVIVSADVFGDGHDRVAAAVLLRSPSGDTPTRHRMQAVGNDRWEARIRPDELGLWHFSVIGWMDAWTGWREGATAKAEAGVLEPVDLEIGRALLAHAEAEDPETRARLDDASARLAAGDLPAVIDDPLVDDAMWTVGRTDPEAGTDRSYPLDVDRERAEFGAWYELFPRSFGPDGRHGTLADVGDQLARIAGLGFDVVYLPPIHPIGRLERKGPNNTAGAGPDDVGSPWAIGSAEGGHTSVHPELGTVDDLENLVARARGLDLELALDLAFQCAPDHPWVAQHPEWFRARPDGTIQYAENPPKKYQDIYPIDFESDDWRALWRALHGVVQFWIDRGVRIFRVDNPHTKQLAFWEWLLGRVRQTDPDVLFLSEAFTRPKLMHQLAKVGFDQSYTYFTWRTTAWELAQYGVELTTPPVADFFRPNLWPNTPDILAEPLQHGGRPEFVARAVLAATLASSWGVYGPPYEAMDSQPRDGAEEYLDNEKYQLRRWDLDRTDSLAPLLRRLNEIRNQHPAFRRNRTLHFHPVDNEGLLVYSRAAGPDRVLCVVATDTRFPQSGTIDLDVAALGLTEETEFVVEDQLGGERWTWRGRRQYVRLDPGVLPANVFVITTGREG